MLLKIHKPSQHFNAFYQDNALLIQFAIVEFIATHQITNQIKLLETQLFKSKEDWQKFRLLLLNYFSQLLGTSSHQEWQGGSIWTKGHLTKLKHYCCQFSKNSEHQNKNGILLYTNVHKAWLSALQSAEILNSFQPQMEDQVPTTYLQIVQRHLTRMYNRLNYIERQILRVVRPFSNNENVVFFLLRKKDHLIGIYGPDFISKIFKASIKKQDLFHLLTQQYGKRGFGHLLASINS